MKNFDLKNNYNDFNQSKNYLTNTDQIAFFWVGDDTLIPTYLVKSINLVYQKKVKIFHLTNFITPEIEGTTETLRLNLKQDIMLARLQAYKQFPYNSNLTFFCDADSLLIQKLNLLNFQNDIYLAKRQEEMIMNYHYPEYYPEFVNKKATEVMPYLFGAMAIRNGKNIFSKLLDISEKLPDRFHRWYGDQYSLMLFVKQNKTLINYLPSDLYLKIMRQIPDSAILKNYIQNKIKMITFKGTNSKKYLEIGYNNLFNLYKNN